MKNVNGSRTLFTNLWSAVIIVALVFYAGKFSEEASISFNAANSWVLSNFKWYYIFIVTACLVVSIVLAANKKSGSILLGKDGEKPEFSYWSWIAMLFAAGMGIGLVFWSIAEPMYHYASNPFITEGSTHAQKAQSAMRLTFFHWGLHPWAIYAIVGLALSYFSYRKGLPLTISSTLYPILGEKVHGKLGIAINVLAIFSTIFGVATSLGLGVQQIGTGLDFITGNTNVYSTGQAYYILIALIMSIAIFSAVTGVTKGVRILSEWNMWTSLVILLFIIIFGPTTHLIESYIQNVGDYLSNIVSLSLWTNAYSESPWQSWWTAFYWGWWMAWAPFVGLFIARISKGRTIREFIVGTLVVSCTFTFIWLTAFGNSAIFLENAGKGILAAVKADLTTSMYVTFAALDLGTIVTTIVSIISTILIVTYFVTSADSGTLVITTIASDGDPEPKNSYRVMWGVIEGLVAAILLAVGGLKALQTASIVAALPFSFIILGMIISIFKDLKNECKS